MEKQKAQDFELDRSLTLQYCRWHRVRSDAKRIAGRNYRVIRFRDPKPVRQFLDETLK
jgi:hypothetical protein